MLLCVKFDEEPQTFSGFCEGDSRFKTDFGELTILQTGAKLVPATEDTLGGIKVGENLKITEDGVLSVITTNRAEEDNTKPITSAGVSVIVGNIDVLLKLI